MMFFIYWKLIKEFGNISSVPEDVVNCFLRTKMDVFVLNSFIIKREP